MLRLEHDALERLVSLAKRAAAIVDDGPDLGELRGYEQVYAEIQSLLGRSEQYLPMPLWWTLGRPLEIATHLKVFPEVALFQFHCIRDATRQVQFLPPFTEEDVWIKALVVAERYMRLEGRTAFSPNVFQRPAIVARSFQYLKQLGYDYEVSTAGVSLLGSSFKQLCERIGSLVEQIGGANVVSNIFRILHAQGRMYRGLFLYGRSVSWMSKPREPSVPWHYIYNLALKYIAVARPAGDPAAAWKELVELAQHFGVTFNVEEYQSVMPPAISPYLVDRSIQENLIWDELFSFQQWSADQPEALLNQWLDCLEAEGISLPLADAATWRNVVQTILSASGPHTPGFVHWSVAAASPEFEPLFDALAIEASLLNANYVTPLDTPSRNAPSYPLFRIGRGRYVVPPKGLAARALYNSLLRLILSQGGKGLSNPLGKAFERLVGTVLHQAKMDPTVSGGIYYFPKKPHRYEVDFVVESSGLIDIIECKRKPLTNLARAGAMPNATLDIARSIFAMVIQLAQHEIALRTNDQIAFESGTVLHLQSREVERIAISMLDHGSLQNPTFIRSLIAATQHAQFHSSDAAIDEDLREVNDIIKEMHEKLEELRKISGKELSRFYHEYSFDLWWLSVDQLSVLISGAESLNGMLRPIRNIVFQTGDIMNEFALADNFRRSAPAQTT